MLQTLVLVQQMTKYFALFQRHQVIDSVLPQNQKDETWFEI